jgi:hypothetical protein
MIDVINTNISKFDLVFDLCTKYIVETEVINITTIKNINIKDKLYQNNELL